MSDATAAAMPATAPEVHLVLLDSEGEIHYHHGTPEEVCEILSGVLSTDDDLDCVHAFFFTGERCFLTTGRAPQLIVENRRYPIFADKEPTVHRGSSLGEGLRSK